MATGKGAQHGRKWDHLRTADPVIVSKHRAATQGPPAAWRDFLQSSTYGHMEGEESEVVDVSVLDKLQPDFNKRYDETMHRDVESKTSRRKQSKTIWKRLWSMVLRHYLIPLTFRLTVMVTSIIALAIAARIYKVENAKSGSSPERAQSIVAIAVDTVALPYIGYMLWDEYTGKPLGLRPAVQKISLILLDLFFIIFKSASTSLAFESLVFHNVDAGPARHLSKALASFQLVGLLAWTMNFVVNIFRTVQRLGGGEDESSHDHM
ncbi:hypothetical protein COL154_007190 [Colletotrichum chrysophilum]|nr:hypothetical protein Brms1b_000996 [Colletotrichum noveboracense]KAJ0360967.1 hypothetical protein COL154_007190 [Colletotrichum chrysophilum]